VEPRGSNAASDGEQTQVPPFLRKFSYGFVSFAAAALLALHTIGISSLEIDTTSLGLLALLLLVPLAPNIRRLSAAGVEAEIIGFDEARRLQASASGLPSTAKQEEEGSVDPEIEDLIERDPPLGLAKLRIELESELRRLCTAHAPEIQPRGLSLGAMAGELKVRKVLSDEIAKPLSKVSTLTNRAVHGEYVPPEVAAEIGQVGLRVLAALRRLS
jgi:hypothetical protein